MNELKKVKVLTIIGKPVGVITKIYQPVPYNYTYLYWVRLKDGTLLKDITDNEIEVVK